MTSLTRSLLDFVLGDRSWSWSWSSSSWRIWTAMSVIMPALTQLVQNVAGTYYPAGKRNGRATLRQQQQHRPVQPVQDASHPPSRTMGDFAAEVCSSFGAVLLPERMLEMSRRLQAEYRQCMAASTNSMLPLFQHTLPTGREAGSYLALDVGGSTLRLALISLRGDEAVKVKANRITSYPIDERIRQLRGPLFFDWMAARIDEMLSSCGNVREKAMRVGLAWSFPIEQTTPQSGRLLAMGKGFHADENLIGFDLGEIVARACRKRGLQIEMCAIVNDGAATLLSKAYYDQSTRMSLILGTGMNAAVYLPVPALGRSKYNSHPADWHATATRVVVNTELSMFGKNVLPTSRWDDQLNAAHVRPNFQPYEYLLTGRYLGEIVRLVLVDGITTAGLFNGHMPGRLSEPYAFDTRVLAAFEADSSPHLVSAATAFQSAHPLPSPPRHSELVFVRDLARLVSRRAAAYLSISLHALFEIRAAAEQHYLKVPSSQAYAPVTVACDGSMIEKYPGFRPMCQAYLDKLCALSGTREERCIALEMMPESSILGAAVAACCNAATA